MTERRFESGTGWLRMPEVRSSGREKSSDPPVWLRLRDPDFCLPAQLASIDQSAVLAGAQRSCRHVRAAGVVAVWHSIKRLGEMKPVGI